MSEYFSYREEGGIGQLVLDMPDKPVNLLTSPVMQDLDRLLAGLQGRRDLSLLVIRSAKPGIFIAGADINEIYDIHERDIAYSKAKVGQDVLNRLEMLNFPSLAYINGACMGGGTELALACTFRVVGDSPKVSIALPEVNLGVMPGFGGTQRLPRLIDLGQALPMILSGKTVDSRKAEKNGLADKLVPEGYFEFFLRDFAAQLKSPVADVQKTLPGSAEYEAGRTGYAKSLDSYHAWQAALRSRLLPLLRRGKKGKAALPKRNRFISDTALGRSIALRTARKQVLSKTLGNYPAPLKALDILSRTLGRSLARGLEIEAAGFAELAVTEVSKHLIQLYFLSEQSKKLPDVSSIPGAGGKPGSAGLKDQTRRTGVLGAGVMGGGIAWLLADRGYPVVLKDINWDAVQKGYDAASGIYSQMKKIRKADDMRIAKGMQKISGTLDYAAFTNNDFVVEAVVEKMEVKKAVLKDLEQALHEGAVIATNTSSLSVTAMAQALKRPERFAGMHFFNPVNRMPLVEVISGEKTDPEVALEIARLSLKLKKTPVFVKDGPGFLVNRILMPYLNEAAHLLGEGADMQKVDRLWKRWGMPMGPFTLIDEIGIDVAHKVAKILEDAYPERMKAAPLLEALSGQAEFLGKKNGKGFYLYEKGKKSINPAMQQHIAKVRKDGSPAAVPGDEDIIMRPLVMMINEGIRCLDEGVVASPGMLDLAMIMGTGFPPFRGGLMRSADTLGIAALAAQADRYASKLGQRFAPPEGLKSRAAAKSAIYPSRN